MTAKTKDGKVIFKGERIYMPQATTNLNDKMIYGAHWKVGFIRDTSIQPYKGRKETFDIKLPMGVRTVDVTAELTYQLIPGDKIPIHTVTRKVSID
ncbi:MAG: hypothetical protein ABIJ44_06880 [Pseudomonadota bacterium]